MNQRAEHTHRSRNRDMVVLACGLLIGGVVTMLLVTLRDDEHDSPEQVWPAQVSQLDEAPVPTIQGPAAPDRLAFETPALDEAVPGRPIAQATSENPFEGPGATEALRAHRLAELERYWEQVAVARERNHEGDLLKVNALLLFSMKPILDEAGFGEKQVGTRTDYPADKHYLFVNGLDYFVPHGQYPVVDRYYQLWQEWSARSEAAREHDRWAKVPFVLDEPFLISLEAMKNQAIEAIERRTEMY